MTPSIPLTEPSISCGVLKIWVLAREFPNATDFWDSNWLDVIASCSEEGATVTVTGSILRLDEIDSWRSQLIKLDETLKGAAELPTLEPNLHLKLECNKLGHIASECYITPNHMTQSHTFEFEIDQSFLKGLIPQCNRILEEYPIRNPQNK